jgi:hypothetical protein
MCDSRENCTHHPNEEEVCTHNDALRHSSLSQSLDEIDFERSIFGKACSGDIEEIKKLIRGGLSVNLQDRFGYTALV